jgi:RepB plasmid partitioning protein
VRVFEDSGRSGLRMDGRDGLRSIERNVPRDKIARALDINVRSVARKVQLLDGICREAIGLLKVRICPMAVFDVLRKMRPLRQIEAAELLINANNFSVMRRPYWSEHPKHNLRHRKHPSD